MTSKLTKKKDTLPQLTKSLGKLLLLLDWELEVLLGKAYHLAKTHIWSAIFHRRNRSYKTPDKRLV